MPRPRGGDWFEDEIGSIREAGVNLMVSLLEKDETTELDLLEEESLCKNVGIEFISFPIPDRCVPSSSHDTYDLVRKLAARLNEAGSIAIHCRQGIGRSAMIAACVLAMSGEEVEAAFKRVAKARGCAVPDTQQQREWVAGFAENLLRS